MSSVYAKRGKLFARIKGLHKAGAWGGKLTKYKVGQEALAERFATELQRQIDNRVRVVLRDPTVREWAMHWLPKRKALGIDWKNDRYHLGFILPLIGARRLAEVRTPDLVDLFMQIRTEPRPQKDVPAPRVVWNIYTTLKAMFRDAKLAGQIEQTPCELGEPQLGPRVDLDPEWRAGQLFTRPEAVRMISDRCVPRDRQQCYALGLLAGLRPGEISAARWRQYDPTMRPLGRLLVAKSYSSRKDREKGTKTLAVRHVPVHPVLAAMLADWRTHGWPAMMGRAPEPDDLIVPLPPAAVKRRRKRTGEAFRGSDYLGRLWLRTDLPALGLRPRELYATKSTFVTLALDDGADAHVIEGRVTHTSKGRGAFHGYNRGLQWAITCAEVAKLQIEHPGFATTLLPTPASSENPPGATPETSCSVQPTAPAVVRSRDNAAVDDGPAGAADLSRLPAGVVARLATVDALAEAVLAGDMKLARKLARQTTRPRLKAV